MRQFLTCLLLAAASSVAQQIAQAPVPPKTGTVALPHVVAATVPDIPQTAPTTYVLGPDDSITVHALDAEELSEKPTRIDLSGYIRLPLAGRIKAAGMTVEQLEAEIDDRLLKYIKDPEVSVSVLEFRSQPVSVIGSVKSPGVYQLQRPRTLVECLSLAGGPSDDAGYSVKITRHIEKGPIPLPSAVTDSTGHFSVAEVDLGDVMTARKPEENIAILTDDIISVPRGAMVYVIGTVPRTGGYVLHEHETLSVLQALSLAGGLDHFAKPENARILRQVPGNGNRIEIPVNLKTVLTGESGDVPLQAEDILLVPSSNAKKAWARAAEAAIQIGSFSIYKF